MGLHIGWGPRHTLLCGLQRRAHLGSHVPTVIGGRPGYGPLSGDLLLLGPRLVKVEDHLVALDRAAEVRARPHLLQARKDDVQHFQSEALASDVALDNVAAAVGRQHPTGLGMAVHAEQQPRFGPLPRASVGRGSRRS